MNRRRFLSVMGGSTLIPSVLGQVTLKETSVKNTYAKPCCGMGGYHEVTNIKAFDPAIPEDKEYLDESDYKFYATCTKCNMCIVATHLEHYVGHVVDDENYFDEKGILI